MLNLRAKPFLFLVVALLMGATGCALLPEMRVFQKKVPNNSEKPAAQLEAERQAAEYIVLRSSGFIMPTDSGDFLAAAQALADIHGVATGLSASLGVPKKKVVVEDKDAIIASLRAGLKAKDAQLESWKTFSRKYAGKELESTGIDLAGPTGLLVFAGVIAACVFVPGFGYVMLRVLPLLWGALRRVITGVESFAKENVAEGQKLKTAYLARKMDAADKLLIKRRKRSIRPEELVTTPATS